MKETAHTTLEGHTAEVWSLCFLPDHSTLASGGDQTVRLWNITTGQLLKTITTHHSVYDVVRSVCFTRW